MWQVPSWSLHTSWQRRHGRTGQGGGGGALLPPPPAPKGHDRSNRVVDDPLLYLALMPALTPKPHWMAPCL